MNELFGISMNIIMVILLALFGGCLAAIAVVWASNRMMFRMGLRNIGRRRAQSSLVISGLMLATVVITAAFGTGDTVDSSVKNTAYDNLQRTDLSIHHFRSESAIEQGETLDEQRFVDQRVVTGFEEAFANDPDIEGFMPFLYDVLPVLNPRTRLSEPFLFFAGFDAERLDRFGGLHYANGDLVDLAALAPNEALVGEAAADDLEAKPGDTIMVYVQGQPVELKVAGIVKDERATGFLEMGPGNPGGIAVPMATLQQMTGREGKITTLNVAIEGGVRGTLDRAEAAAQRLDAFERDESAKERAGLGGQTFQVERIKQDVVDDAEMAGSLFTSMFIVMGLFSIAAGAMLIFTLFVMLAAERRTEMGIARAIGAQRINLVQSFLAEGMVYDLVAGVVGAFFGVVAAVLLVVVGVRLAFGEELDFIRPYVSPRSIIVSFCLGAVLTFITVVVSSFRVSHLTIVAAVRGQGESGGRREGRRRTRWLWVVLGILAMPVLPLGLYWLLRKGLGLPWALVVGPSGLVVAALLIWLGFASRLSFPFMFGMSLIPIAVAVLAGWYGAPARLTWSLVGAYLAVYWLAPYSWHDKLFGRFEGSMEMFVLSGIMIVTAFTLLIVWNARLLTQLFATRSSGGRYRSVVVLLALMIGCVAVAVALGDSGDGLGQLFYVVAACMGLFLVMAVAAVRSPRMAPALKMGIAYPLASRFRTGMTISMFSLVVFAIVTMGVINNSFLAMLSSEEGQGGWDTIANGNRNNPVDDLLAALREEGSFDPSVITALGRVTQFDDNSQEARAPGGAWDAYPIIAGDSSFWDNATMNLEGRASQFGSAEEVYAAVKSTPRLALADSSIRQTPGMGGNFAIQVDVDIEDGVFEPFTLEIRDPVTERSETVTIVGILSSAIPGNILMGVYVNEETYRDVLGEPVYNAWYLRLEPGADSEATAKGIKAALVTRGVNAHSIEEMVDEMTASSRGFMRIIQAFMALGLFVGIAALGVIALRSVVERRQQIGMLRAIGYQRGTVALSFILESGFIAMMGIASGVIGACILSWNLLASLQTDSAADIDFIIPWGEVALYSAGAFIFALLMTWWPSHRASSVAIAEALRYE